MRCRILVVEDDAAVAAIVAEALEAEGHAVEAAGTLAEAVAVLGRHAHDLVVLDRGLPDGDGLDLLDRIRSDGRAPTVVFSARDDAEAVGEAYGRGACAFVRKGEGLRGLLSAVRAHLPPPAPPPNRIG